MTTACLRCGSDTKGWEGDKPWRNCPACHFAMHVFRAPGEHEGAMTGGWMCEPGAGLGTFWPWGALPTVSEKEAE